MAYKAILFDLDGTLLNTLKDLADSVSTSLSLLGFPTHEYDVYKRFISAGMETLAMCALPKDHRDEDTVNKLIAAIKKEYSKRWINNTLPYPGITELLEALVKRNVKMTVLSNNPHNLSRLMVSRLLSRWYFDAVVGAQLSVPKKPDPSAALQIALRLAIPPAEFLYLGDSDIDMQTATAADMYPVGALWGFCTADELLSSGANKLIRHPTDLLGLL